MQSKHLGVAALKPSPVGEGGPLAVEEDNFNNLQSLLEKSCFKYRFFFPLSSFTRYARKIHFDYAANAPSLSAFGLHLSQFNGKVCPTGESL